MRAISIECVIGGDPYSARQLDDIEHARHVHVLHDLKQLGVAIEHGGHPLSNEGIDLLSLEQARSVSAGIRTRLGADGARALYHSRLRASAAMWREADGASTHAPLKVSETHLTIRGITLEDYRKVIRFDRFEEIYPLLNPDHFFARSDGNQLHLMETFGMHGGPCELVVQADMGISVPIERRPDYPILVAGYATMAEDGASHNLFAYHQV